ncbi:MAG TPA: CoA transferase [Myxococcota bacterium]|nr:CoA transferase [Myxococcota bacterium]
MPGPLTGYRVVDLTAFVAGPLATQLLAEQGADVVKIEPLGGDLLRRIGTGRAGIAALFASVNRNKRSVALDLRKPEGLDVVRRLAASADVLVENFRPGAMEKMGLGPKEMCAANARLVYARVTGFGDEGPYQRMPVFDTLVQGFSGIAWAQGQGTGRPVLLKTLVADKIAPLLAAQAITSALLERTRSGAGQTLQVSMLDSMIWWMWPDNMMDETFLDQDTVHSPLMSSLDNLMRTADGFLTIAPVSDASWEALAELVGRPDWLLDPRFASMASRNVNVGVWFGVIQQEIARRTTGEWLELLAGSPVPHAPVHTLESVLRDEQVRANCIVEEHEHPKWGRMRQPRPVARFGRSRGRIESLAPDVGEHTLEVLEESGYSATQIHALRMSETIA